jgi:DHA1 family multidrug resistance protein-like MFS transporter
MKQRIFLIINLSVVSALVILGFAVISPVLPQYALSFSISVAMTGWAVSSFALARLFMDMPAGILADRFGRKRNMIVGLVLIVVFSVVSGTAKTYGLLILGRIGEGLGSALYITSATAWVAEASAGEYRGRFMSLYSGLVFAGTAFGPAIGGYSAAHFGLNGPFFVYAGLVALGLLATVPLKEETPSASTGPRISLGDVRAVLASGSFLLVNSAVFALFFLRAGVRSTLLPLYASLNLGLSEEKIGLLMTVAAVVTSLVTFPSGWLSDRVGRKIPIMSCLLLSALAVLLIPFQTNMGTLLAAMAFYGLCTGLQGSIAAWPADVAPNGRLGTAMGVYRVIGDMGFVLGPITATYIAGNTGNMTVPILPFVIPAAIALLASVVLVWAKDPAAKRKMGTTHDYTAET